jgi:drug/metabolite transporter (DMT)-like permease
VRGREERVAAGLAAIVVSSVLFGAMAVLVRAAARDLSALQIAGVRFLGALAVLLAAGGRESIRPRVASRAWLVLRGALGVGAVVLYFQGIRGAGAGLATLIHNTYPIFTALFAVTLLGERFSARLATALVLNLAGVVVLLGPSVRLRPEVVVGGVVALVGSVFSGAAVAAAHRLRASESALTITTYFMAVGTIATAPALLGAFPALTLVTAALLAGVVLTSVGGQLLLHQGLGITGATQGGLAAATSVVTAAALEATFLGERLAGSAVLGAGLMLLAVALASRDS